MTSIIFKPFVKARRFCSYYTTKASNILILTLVVFILLLSILSLRAKEIKIGKFDASKKSMEDLVKVIEDEIAKGASTIHFPSGKWKWHKFKFSELEQVEEGALSHLFLKLSEPNYKDVLLKWIIKNKVQALQLCCKKTFSAQTFFEIEKYLDDLKIPYVIMSCHAERAGDIFFLQSDGDIRELVLTDKALHFEAEDDWDD